MHSRTILLMATLVLPIFAAPVPASQELYKKDVESKRQDTLSLTGLIRDVIKRTPVIEAIPVAAQSETLDGDEEEADEFGKRAVRPDSGIHVTRAVRGQGHEGDERSVDERAIRGHGHRGDKKSVDVRAIRGQGNRGDKRSVDERAIRGHGHGGDKRSIVERAVRSQVHKGDRRSIVRALASVFG